MGTPLDAKKILQDIANNNPLEFIFDPIPNNKVASWGPPKKPKIKINPKFRKSNNAFDRPSFLNCLANADFILKLCHSETESPGDYFNTFNEVLIKHESNIHNVLEKLPDHFKLNFYFLLFYSCGGVFAERGTPLVIMGKNKKRLPESEIGKGKLNLLVEWLHLIYSDSLGLGASKKNISINFRFSESKNSISITNQRTALKIIELIINHPWDDHTNTTEYKYVRTKWVKNKDLQEIALDFYNCFRGIGITKNKSRGFTGWLLYFSGRIKVEINNRVPKSKPRANKVKSDADKNMEDKVKGLLTGCKLF